jgi:hypothetical protein
MRFEQTGLVPFSFSNGRLCEVGSPPGYRDSMKSQAITLTAILLIFALATNATPPGNYVFTFEYLVFADTDFKDGFGLADPADQNSPCTSLFLGGRGIQPISGSWEGDQNIGNNLNGPGMGVSKLVPPLTPAGGWLPDSGGINTGFPCPLPGSGTGTLWVVWSGMNWRSILTESFTKVNICDFKSFPSSSAGCLAVPSTNMQLFASACSDWSTARFGADYTDGKGKYAAGIPFDQLALKSDQIECPIRHSHDYTHTIQDFSSGLASQTFDAIKNEAVVHAGSGTTYIAVCWRLDYLNFQNPLAPVWGQVRAHDWKLILDIDDLGAPGSFIAPLQRHYGSAISGDFDVGSTATGMRGFYSHDPGNARGNDVGQNGFGPCPASAPLPEGKKPAPII